MTDWASHEKLYTLAEERFGPVDAAIIVAGILESSDLLNDAEQGRTSWNVYLIVFLPYFR